MYASTMNHISNLHNTESLRLGNFKETFMNEKNSLLNVMS